MKKLTFMVLAGCLVGCTSTWKDNGNITCTSQNNNEAMQSNVELHLQYENNKVVKHVSNTSLIAKDASTYEQLKAVVESAKTVYETMEGAKYQVQQDDEAFTLKENIELDFTVLSDENRSKVLSYGNQQDYDAKEVKETLEQQGYQCQVD